jgi:hypothetical protein
MEGWPLCADAGEHTPKAIEARAIRETTSLRSAVSVELKRDTQHSPPKPRHESAAF